MKLEVYTAYDDVCREKKQQNHSRNTVGRNPPAACVSRATDFFFAFSISSTFSYWLYLVTSLFETNNRRSFFIR